MNNNKVVVYKDTNEDLYTKHKDLYVSLGYEVVSELETGNEKTCTLSRAVGGVERKVIVGLNTGGKTVAIAK